AYFELVLRVKAIDHSPQMPVRVGESQSRCLRNTKEKVGVSGSSIRAGEVVLTVHVGADVISVEPVANRVEAEFHEMAATGPTQVINPLERRLGIVLEVVRLRIRAPGSDPGDIEEWPGRYACGGDSRDAEPLQ